LGAAARQVTGSAPRIAGHALVQLRHFFENMVRREETASAFLATLLDYDSAFRWAFLGLATDDAAIDDVEPWVVRVEEDRVDVTLESPTTYVLIGTTDELQVALADTGQYLLEFLRPFLSLSTGVHSGQS